MGIRVGYAWGGAGRVGAGWEGSRRVGEGRSSCNSMGRGEVEQGQGHGPGGPGQGRALKRMARVTGKGQGRAGFYIGFSLRYVMFYVTLCQSVIFVMLGFH